MKKRKKHIITILFVRSIRNKLANEGICACFLKTYLNAEVLTEPGVVIM